MSGATDGPVELRCGAALSEHPVPAHATGEVVGELLEHLGGPPEVAALFVTAPHAGALDDIADTVRRVLSPAALVGCAASGVVGGAREVEEQPAVSLWGAAGVHGPLGATATHLGAVRGPDGVVVTGLDPGRDPLGALVLLADPFSFPIDAVLGDGAMGATATVVGGSVSAARGPGGNRLVVDGAVHHDGAAALVLPRGVLRTTVVSQGCRPIGDPWTVTRGEGAMLAELGGRPALDRLVETVEALGEDDRRLASRALHIGVVVDEAKARFDRGDFLVRAVAGVDRSNGALAVGDEVGVGRTVQFHVRDAASADEDLRSLLGDLDAEGALLFTCAGRGTRLFGEPDHDASLLASAVGPGAVAGMACAGEIGPVGGRPQLHAFTASIALFGGARR